MPFVLYDYADHKGNCIQEWAKGKPWTQLAKLNQRLDRLIHTEPDLIQGLLHPAGMPRIWKIKIHGSPQLRPMLCKGPLNMDTEFTILIGAVEIQNKLIPPVGDADARRLEIIATGNRRVKHERFKRNP